MNRRTHHRAGQARNGFTLIEILVVVLIIGIIVSMVTISVGVLGRDTEVQDQSKRLWAILTQAKEESELLGRNVGVIVDQTGYDFVKFDSEHWSWTPISDDDLLAPRQLPPGLQIVLVLEGREVVLKPHNERKPPAGKTDEESEEKAKEPVNFKKTLQDADMAPHIMLLASGDVNSFDLKIERQDTGIRWHVQSKPDNTFDYGEVNAPE